MTSSSSLSGPHGYITVRTKAKKKGDESPNVNTELVSYVENRPYIPLLNVDPANLDTVINVANIIVSSLFCNNNDNNNNGVGATNSNNDNDREEEGKVTVITGGLTNALFKVDLPNNNGTKYPSVLVRIFGADGMINRDEETTNFVRLCNMGSNNNVVHDQLDVLGRFGNGRVETWIPNMRQAHYIHDFNIEGFELEVARQLARLHYGFDVTNVAVVHDDNDDEGRQQQQQKHQHEPTLWKVIKTWIDELSQQLSHEQFQKVASDSDTSSSTSSLMELFSFAIMNNDSCQKYSSNEQLQQQGCTDNIITSLYNELEWLKQRVTTDFPNASIVFCHNDVNAANILLDTTTATVTSIDDNNDKEKDQSTRSSKGGYNKHNVCIIDYEYGSINYAMYDIANYICEHCGGNDNGIPNYDLLPTNDRIRKILIEYVNERDAILLLSSKEEEGGGCRKQNDVYATKDEEVTHLMSQVELFQMASNLYWGVWGVLQAAGEVVATEEESDHDGALNFNNLEDAMSRLDGKIDLTRWDNLRYGSNRLKRYHVCKRSITSANSINL